MTKREGYGRDDTRGRAPVGNMNKARVDQIRSTLALSKGVQILPDSEDYSALEIIELSFSLRVSSFSSISRRMPS